jgi:hypothetical protein
MRIRILTPILFLLAPLALRADTLGIRLHQPSRGTTLTGGSTAVVTWSADALPPQVEEWEAFLSVDGGRYYASRITPHLNVSIRQFHFEVPNVASRDARIMLRFGNERNETEIEFATNIKITASAVSRRVPTGVGSMGESARPGDPGVATWIDGDREGSHLKAVEASIPIASAAMRIRSEDCRSCLLASNLSLSAPRCIGRVLKERQLRSIHAEDFLPKTTALMRSCRLNV